MKYIFFLLFAFTNFYSFSQTAEQLSQKAVEAGNANDNKTALKLIDKAIKINPSNSRYYCIKALAFYNNGELKNSLETLKSAEQLFPNDANIYLLRANIFSNESALDYALRECNIAFDLAQDDTLKQSILLLRSVIKINSRNYNGAYEDLKAILKLDSNNVGALINLGGVCGEIGKNDETLHYLKRALEIDSTAYGAYANIGWVYQEQGDYKTAIEYYTKYINSDNDDAAIGYSNRAYNRLKLGDIKGAEEDVALSIKLLPKNAYVYKVRGLIYLEQNQKDKACEAFKTAIDQGYTQLYGNEVLDLQKKNCAD